MSDESKLPETVILADSSFLNFIVSDVKTNFERILTKSLPKMDLVSFFVYIAMDAGAQSQLGDAEVVLLCNAEDAVLHDAMPSDLKKELDGKACKTEVGEMSFTCVDSEGFASTKDLLTDVYTHICKIKGLKRIAFIADDTTFDSVRDEILKNKPENVDLTKFRMDRQVSETEIRHEILVYPVLRALGVRSEDLH